MDLTDLNTVITVVAAVAIIVGLVGIVVPALPGLLLCWAGVLVWAIFADGGWGKWLVLAVVTVVALTGTVVKYPWPGQKLKRTGVPNSSLIAGGLLGLVGFFVLPVLGLVIGFVLGIWLAERTRQHGDSQLAWRSTKEALKAVGVAMLIELGAGLLVAVVWLIGLAVA